MSMVVVEIPLDAEAEVEYDEGSFFGFNILLVIC